MDNKQLLGTEKVSLYQKNDRIYCNFRVNGDRFRFSLGLKWDKDNLKLAQKRASEIDSDILFNRFDGNIEKYKFGFNPKLIETKVNNVVDIKTHNALSFNVKSAWELYKKHKKATIALTTQKKRWTERDRIIALLESENLLDINKADEALDFLLEKYTYSTLQRYISDFRTAINLAIELGKYDGKNYYQSILSLFPKHEKKQIQAYTQDEMRLIVEAFTNNTYISKQSRYKSDYYTGLVEFRFLTGCRPSEAIAITWNDVYDKNSFTWIKFDKAYVDGILKPTKTEDIRVMQCYPQLLNLLERLPKIDNSNNLIFPSIRDKSYIDSHNFSNRYWREIVRDGLFDDGLISKYLPWYDERHTFITHACRNGIDPQTVAKMVGNSADIIIKHYWAINENLSNLPNIY